MAVKPTPHARPETTPQAPGERAIRQLIFDNADGILVVEPSGMVRFANAAASQLLRPVGEALVGTEFGHPVGAGKVIEMDIPQTARVAEMRVSEIDWEGAPALLASLRDVTDRKQAEQGILALNAELEQRVRERTAELRASNEELEAFVYSVSHDLRAPLRTMDGFSKELVERYGPQLDERGRDYLSRVRAGAQRMGAMTEDLLQLSRVSRPELRREQVNLSAPARDIAAELQRTGPQRRVEFVIAENLTARCDPDLVEIVLENLLSNAWKFTSTRYQARIEVGKSEQDGHTAFFVHDNGVGFAMAQAEQLFKPFQRLHRIDEFPGTGIGLASVHRIITRHGGRIWADAQPDRGAKFTFTLEPNRAPN